MPTKSQCLAVVAACALALPIVNHAQQGPVGVQEPAWARDGKRLALSYLDRVWTLTPDGKQPKALTAIDGGVEREPAWSPDGTKVAFAADRGNGFDIFVVGMKNGVAAGAPTVVTNTPGDERWPSWTPDGRIVFAHRAAPAAGHNGDASLQIGRAHV